MAMSTQTASAISRSAKKLKDLATDAVTIPSTEELYTRKCADLTEAKSKLAALVARQLKIEGNSQHQSRDVDAIVAEKKAAEAKVARLEHEGGLLKQQLIDARPPQPLTQQQQFWADAFSNPHDPYARCARGTPEQIAAAQKELDALVLEYKLNQPTGIAREAWSVKSNAARTRLAVLQGPPYPPYRPWASEEQMKAARVAEGLNK